MARKTAQSSSSILRQQHPNSQTETQRNHPTEPMGQVSPVIAEWPFQVLVAKKEFARPLAAATATRDCY
jgi:hypothetical protein